MLRGIRQTVQHEGGDGTYEDVDGGENLIEYEKITAGFALTREEMSRGSFETIVAQLDEVAETFAEAQSRILLSTVSEAAGSVGNVVDAKGKLTKEAFLELLHKMQWSFDPHTGEHQHPMMVVHPETLEKIKHDLESWERDPEFLAEMSAIEQQQRLDWRDRESRRRLAD